MRFNLLPGLFQTCAIQIKQRHIGSGFSQTRGNGLADTAACAGDEGHFFLQ